jgi:hypothetical protein
MTASPSTFLRRSSATRAFALRHGFRNISPEDADVRGILRQRDAGADTDLEHAAADLVGGDDGGTPAFAEHAAEHEVIDWGPAVVGLLDRGAVEVQLAGVVKFHNFSHDHSLVGFPDDPISLWSARPWFDP